MFLITNCALWGQVALVQLNICPIDHIESILDVDYRSKRENEPIGVGKV